jgi:hypothetical protein
MPYGGHLQRNVTCLWKEPGAAKKYRAGVSLHSHTNRSKEGLYFIIDFAARYRPLRDAIAAEERHAIRERQVTTLDFWKSYWTPPLPPLAAFECEKNQIEGVLGLESMVSITDHDNIEAPMLLRVVPEARRIPVSVEWTVPFHDATFHLGVHNLPSGRAESIMAALAEYTRNPDDLRLPEILSALHDIPEVLVVLNHPMWDLAHKGQELHDRNLRLLLCKHGQFIHALELSGIRSWQENQSVLHLSEACNQVVISGGDRHGCEPNAALNLTNAGSFTEFAYQVRRERSSHVLFMPQYTESSTLRILQTLQDVIREYPDYSIDSRCWDDRVFHPDSVGVIRPLSSLWKRPPFYIRHLFSLVHLLQSTPVRRFVQFALAKPQQDVRFVLGNGQEVAP